MRLLKILIVFTLICCVFAKNSGKSLSDIAAQELIEIGPRVNDLLPLEEEPAPEDEDDDQPTTTTVQVATKKETKKSTTEISNTKRTSKYNAEEEEAKIERSLAAVYKDDYKDEESDKRVGGGDNLLKPIERDRKTNFKFQPDLTNEKEVQRFRTSIDEITCDRRVTSLYGQDDDKPKPTPGSSFRLAVNLFLYAVCLICAY